MPRCGERIVGIALAGSAQPAGAAGQGRSASGWYRWWRQYSGGGPIDVRRKLGRHLRSISEHKPHELRVSVNGFLVSSLKISSDLTEVDLNLNPEEPVEFVEITSEQDVQLLFFSSGKGYESEQWAWIELSEGRTLAVFLRLQDGPSLQCDL